MSQEALASLLLDSLQQQLKVRPEEALSTAERILDAKLQCSLGGQYVLENTDSKTPQAVWESSAWPKQIAIMGNKGPSLGFDDTKSLPPAEYQAPWLQWFRGAQLHLTQLPERLVVVGTIDIEPVPVSLDELAAEKTNGSSLPKMDLDLFNLPFQFFQGDKPRGDKGSEKKPAETRKSF